MKVMLRQLVVLAYTICSLVLPKQRGKLCFLGAVGSDNGYALFEHLMSRPHGTYRYVWLVQDGQSTDALSRDYAPALASGLVRVVPKRSVRGIWELLTASQVFFTHGTYWFARSGHRQRIVNVWHGMPLKRVCNLNPNRVDPTPFCHFTLATSPFYRTIMARCFGLPEERVLLTGQPRNDWLLTPVPDGLPSFLADRPRSSLIVWMPTYRTYQHPKAGLWVDSTDDFLRNLLSPPGLERIQRRMAERNVLCVIKLHPLDMMNELSFADLPNVVVIREADVQRHRLNTYKMLAHCDRLVTDFSSVFIDFVLTGRPMAFFAPDVDEYIAERGFIDEVWKTIGLPGRRLKDEDELLRFLVGDLEPDDVPADVAAAMNDGYAPPSCELVARQLGL